MTACALCSAATHHPLRVAGLDVCQQCHTSDPTAALAALGVPAEWDTHLQRFSAGLGIPEQDPDFTLRCSPERWHHRLSKLVVEEVQVGDEIFDSAVFVKTSSSARARALLASEGVQAALLTLLSDVHPGELVSNHVSLTGPTLTVSVRHNQNLDQERTQELQLATAALALHLLKRAPASDA